jgi:hypothetical protein
MYGALEELKFGVEMGEMPGEVECREWEERGVESEELSHPGKGYCGHLEREA